MKLLHRLTLIIILGSAMAAHLTFSAITNAQTKSSDSDRAKYQKQYDNGNYKDAYEGFRKLAMDPNNDPMQVGSDLTTGIAALAQLARIDEIDDFRDAVIKAHPKNWRLLMAAADSLLNGEHFGFIIAGKFSRGQHRGGGQAVNSLERDRVQALQLMMQAISLAEADSRKTDVADFWMAMSQMLLANRGYTDAWRLQSLTKLDELPDYEQGWYWNAGARGAPVGKDGDPVYHYLPKNWQAAKTDGERWRWALSQVAENNARRLNEVRFQLAEFLQSQFGVQTMAQYAGFFRGLDDDESKSEKNDAAGTWALQSLADNETIARLASGVKRFKLPDEFDFIRIYLQIADEPKTGHGEKALAQLARIYENRRQYSKAADYWRRSIKEYGPGENHGKQQELDQIIGNWGRFETVMSQPAGTGATVDFRFRNGTKVSFEARQIDVAKLLTDVKAYLKSNPRQLDWQKLDIGNIGYRLVEQKQDQYVGARVAAWDLELKPRPEHFDKRITVTTPLQKAGAYLLTAKLEGGNTSQIIIWLEDTAIVKKPLAGAVYCYVGDAASGAPVAKASVDFFGYRQRSVGPNRFTIDTQDLADTADADGQVIMTPKADDNQYQWIITATTPAGRLAYLGFTGVWSGQYADAEYRDIKVYTITDRPVYRPGQKVHFKFWVRRAQYDMEDTSDFANQTFDVEIQNPKGEKVLTKPFTADAYGGLEGEYDLPDDAMLGVYQAFVVNRGGGSFRVEEYKKPEYEVTIDAPSEPVMLGEKIKATIKAKYYFGSPVTQARVKYKVTRSAHTARWYPLGRWDWLYEPGYWWYASDYTWYPGWRDWGSARPIATWWGFHPQQPPEIVAESEVQIGPDGTVGVEIDTAIAKLVHTDQDHRYSITAEVVDASRRTIVGQGNVLAARKPFTVYAWLHRGYYHTGDLIKAEFQAQTLDQKPVSGKGVARLYQITYKDGKPVETLARDWADIQPDERGHAELQIQASAAGQFRLAYEVTDEKEHKIEGACLFTIIGEGFDGREFRYNDLELTAEKGEYNPGQTVNLMVSTNRINSTVLLFTHPSNGIYLKPKVLRLSGKTAVEEIAVAKKDMPNFFVEAVTIGGGRLYDEVKEIVVPPESRVLDVSVTPSSETYKPGQSASVGLKLVDSAGQPFVGTAVVAVYDQALEYISAGSNVQDIRSFFWKWRRTHYPQNETNLMRAFWNLASSGKPMMSNIGVFGETAADEYSDELGERAGETGFESGMLRGAGVHGGRGFGAAPGMMMKAAAAPQAAERAAPMALADGGQALPPGADAGGAALVQPMIRTKFADTALWAGAVTTDETGTANVSLTMPENLTTWKVRVWGLGHGTKVGQAETDVITRKDLIARLEGPRFFVEKDEVVLSANVHNYLKSAKKVTVSLELDGNCLSALSETSRQIDVPPAGEARLDWRVKVAREGQAVVRLKALTDEESDAVEQRFPVYVHGMLKTESFTGSLRPEDSVGKVAFQIPKDRRTDQTMLEVRYSPTLAGAMVDALPYLADYPYGCTEQTLNRFLPTVITQHVLIDMGLDLKKIQEKRTNLNAQEIGDDKNRASRWQRFDRNPVFDSAEVGRMVKDGVQRLTDMQLSDGGWGWFSGFGEQSYPHTTAVVVHGLQIAQKNDVALPPGALDRGVEWLKSYQGRQIQLLKNGLAKPKPIDTYKSAADDLDALVYMVLSDAGASSDEMRGYLYRDRTTLSAYSKAMFALALEKQGQKEQLGMLLSNLRQFVVEDDENQTAYLKVSENCWWLWYGSDIEANAYYLKLLAKTDAKGALAPRLVKYLINNRARATYWNSTRDTALVIEALAEYIKASGEDKPDTTVEIWLDGQKEKEVSITVADLFTFDNKFVLSGDALQSGKHVLELRKQGAGPLYYNAYLTNFTLEEPITAAGLEVRINRKVYLLKEADKSIEVAGGSGQVVGQRVEKYERTELPNLAAVKSGDLVEVELEIDSKNDYEYLMFEDFKPAGFEPTDLRSGYNANSLGAYMELRDNRVTFFVHSLARGKHSISYRLRAEVPGQFSALPATATAMYAPELKANSDEIKLKISD
jgi:alpha-2-macroglobulin